MSGPSAYTSGSRSQSSPVSRKAEMQRSTNSSAPRLGRGPPSRRAGPRRRRTARRARARAPRRSARCCPPRRGRRAAGGRRRATCRASNSAFSRAFIARRPPAVLAPEEAVVAEHQLCTGLCGALEQLQVGRHAGRHEPHLGCAGHLKPVRAVVGQNARVEQVVEEGDDLVAGGHARESVICPRRCQRAKTTEFLESLMADEPLLDGRLLLRPASRSRGRGDRPEPRRSRSAGCAATPGARHAAWRRLTRRC